MMIEREDAEVYLYKIIFDYLLDKPHGTQFLKNDIAI